MRSILRKTSAAFLALVLAMALMLCAGFSVAAGEIDAEVSGSLVRSAKSMTEKLLGFTDEQIDSAIETGNSQEASFMQAWKELKGRLGNAAAEQTGEPEVALSVDGYEITCPVAMDGGEVFFIYTINEETGKLTSMKAVEAEEVSAEAEGPAAGEAEGAAEEAQAAEAPQDAPAEEAAGNETIVLDAAEEEQAAAPEAEEAVRELSSEASSATIGEAEEAPVPEEETESVGSTFINAVLNTLMGICTVFIVLVFLSFIISQFKRIPGVDSRKRSAAPAAAAPISVLEPAEELVDDEELVAVITAAIMAANEGTAAEGDGFVVRSIRKSRRK